MAHNAKFDYGFIREACSKCGVSIFSNKQYDTLLLAKRALPEVKDRKLKTIAEYLGIDAAKSHRGGDDCLMTKLVFEKLINLA